MKHLAEEPNPVTTRDAIDMARAALREEARVNAPSGSSMGKKFQREKRKSAEEFGDRGLNALVPHEIIIPQHLEPNVIVNENIQIGGQLRKIITFVTPAALNILDVYRNEIAIDGTFKVRLS